MNLRTKLLGASAALLLSASAAAAMPATAQADLNVRSGPGTQYPVVGSIPAGETVDAGNCTGSWCRVSFSGGSGYANRSYLAMAGGASVGVAVAPSYPYDTNAYGDEYYDDGYAYGAGVGVFVGPRFHRRHGWNDGRNWDRHRVGTWQGRGIGSGTAGNASRGSGFAGPPANWQLPGSGIGPQGGAARSAPTGMPTRGAAPARGAPAGDGFDHSRALAR